MAQHNLRSAADAARRHPDVAERLDVDRGGDRSLARRGGRDGRPLRRRARGAQPGGGVHQPRQMGLRAPRPEQYPLLLHFPYFDLYRKQVVKQADLVLAMHLRGDAFSDDEKAANFAYYEASHRP